MSSETDTWLESSEHPVDLTHLCAHELPTPLYRLLCMFECETNDFRRLHRLIDIFEWLIKWHTTLVLSDLLGKDKLLTPQRRESISLSLQLPSLGNWMSLFKSIVRYLDGESLINWSSLEALSRIDNHSDTRLVAFRNRFAHGATVSDHQAAHEVEKWIPTLRQLLNSPIMSHFVLVLNTPKGLERWMGPSPLRDQELERRLSDDQLRSIGDHHMGVVSLQDEPILLSIHPISRIAEVSLADHKAPYKLYFFYNAIRQHKLEELNYPYCVHLKSKDALRDFLESLPLDQWFSEQSSNRVEFELRSQPILGRKSELNELVEIIADDQFLQMMIISPPGYGKSTLLAHLAHSLRSESSSTSEAYNWPMLSRKHFDVITYFIRRGNASVEVTHFLKHVYINLCKLLSVKINRHHDDLYQLYQGINVLIDKIGLSENKRPVILIVDGLDEALAPNSDTLNSAHKQLLHYIPEPTKFFRIIFGARPIQEINEWANGRRISKKFRLSALDSDAVRGILYQNLNKYDYRITPELISQLQVKSQGCPLFIYSYCDMLTSQLHQLDSITTIPNSINLLYEQLLKQVVSDQTKCYELLYLFAASPEALNIDLICILLNQKKPWVSEWLDRLLVVLIEDTPQSNERLASRARVEHERCQYHLYHESFREFLLSYDSSEYSHAMLRLTELVQEWCRELTYRRKPVITDFVLKVGATILSDVDDMEGLWTLLVKSDLIDQLLQRGDLLSAKNMLELGVRNFAHHASNSSPDESPHLFASLCRLVLNVQALRGKVLDLISQRCDQNMSAPLPFDQLMETMSLAREWRGLQVLTLLLTGETLRREEGISLRGQTIGEDMSLARVRALLEAAADRSDELFKPIHLIPIHCVELSMMCLSWWRRHWPELSDQFMILDHHLCAHVEGSKLDRIDDILSGTLKDISPETSQYERDQDVRRRAIRAWGTHHNTLDLEVYIDQMTYLGSKVELCNVGALLTLSQGQGKNGSEAYIWLKRAFNQRSPDEAADQTARFYERLAQQLLSQGLYKDCESHMAQAIHSVKDSPYKLRRESMYARSISIYATLNKAQELRHLLSQITEERYIFDGLLRLIRSKLERPSIINMMGQYLPQLNLISRLHLILYAFIHLNCIYQLKQKKLLKLISQHCHEPMNEIESQLLICVWSVIKEAFVDYNLELHETQIEQWLGRLKRSGAFKIEDDNLFFTRHYLILQEILLYRCTERPDKLVWQTILEIPSSWRGRLGIEYILRCKKDQKPLEYTSLDHFFSDYIGVCDYQIPQVLHLEMMSKKALSESAVSLASQGWDQAAFTLADMIKSDSSKGELHRRYALKGSMTAALRLGRSLEGVETLLKTELPSISRDLLPIWRRSLPDPQAVASSILLNTTSPSITREFCIEMVLALYKGKHEEAIKMIRLLCPTLIP